MTILAAAKWYKKRSTGKRFPMLLQQLNLHVDLGLRSNRASVGIPVCSSLSALSQFVDNILF